MRRLVDTGSQEFIDESNPSAGMRPTYNKAECINYLRFWLCSLFTHACEHTDGVRNGAKVLLIGTHADEVKSAEQHRVVHNHLAGEFGIDNTTNGAGLLLGQNEGCLDVEWNDEDNLCFFPVDNTRREPIDPIVERLQKKVATIVHTSRRTSLHTSVHTSANTPTFTPPLGRWPRSCRRRTSCRGRSRE
jgi:hypothetical protein